MMFLNEPGPVIQLVPDRKPKVHLRCKLEGNTVWLDAGDMCAALEENSLSWLAQNLREELARVTA